MGYDYGMRRLGKKDKKEKKEARRKGRTKEKDGLPDLPSRRFSRDWLSVRPLLESVSHKAPLY